MVMVCFSPISFRVASLALGQSYDCPSASEATLKDIGKNISTYNHNKTKHNKTVCIFYGIYCGPVVNSMWSVLVINRYRTLQWYCSMPGPYQQGSVKDNLSEGSKCHSLTTSDKTVEQNITWSNGSQLYQSLLQWTYFMDFSQNH